MKSGPTGEIVGLDNLKQTMLRDLCTLEIEKIARTLHVPFTMGVE